MSLKRNAAQGAEAGAVRWRPPRKDLQSLFVQLCSLRVPWRPRKGGNSVLCIKTILRELKGKVRNQMKRRGQSERGRWASGCTGAGRGPGGLQTGVLSRCPCLCWEARTSGAETVIDSFFAQSPKRNPAGETKEKFIPVFLESPTFCPLALPRALS